MGYLENEKIRLRLKNLAQNERLFRINTGMAWAGKIINKIGNKIVIENPHCFHGAPVGTPDLIGFTSKKITYDMVGKQIAVFTVEEIKTESYQIVSKEQKNFIKMVVEMGGIAKVVE
jgi:hypothetical protein